MKELTFSKVDLYDTSRARVSFNLNTLDCLRSSLGPNLVSFKRKSFEKPARGDWRGILIIVSDNTHDSNITREFLKLRVIE